MSESEEYEFTTRTIAGIISPDGRRSAKEVIARRTAEGKLEITPVAGTERTLPLTLEEAEEWAGGIPDLTPRDARESKIKMLCCED